MRINLDNIESKARADAATGEAWLDELATEITPQVVLALIARIRELEAEVDRAAVLLEVGSDRAARKLWAASLRDAAAKGVVLP